MQRFLLVVTLLLLVCATAHAQASGSARSYLDRANERYSKGDLDGAIADFDIAITFDPSLASAYNNRGNARLDRGNLEEALADYDRALELAPRFGKRISN